MTTQTHLTPAQQDISDRMSDILFEGLPGLTPAECMAVLQDLMQAVSTSSDPVTGTWLNQDSDASGNAQSAFDEDNLKSTICRSFAESNHIPIIEPRMSKSGVEDMKGLLSPSN